MKNLTFYNDRMNLNKIPKDLRSFLVSKGIITDDDINVHFVGLIYFKSRPYIFLPRSSNISDIENSSITDKEGIARNLLNAIHIYQQSPKSSVKNDDSGEGSVGETSLSLIISLLEDFNLNGLYKRRIKRKTINSGKINWKKTIRSFSPYPTDDSPFYLDFEGAEKRTKSDNEISRIHAKIIRDISTDLGWLTYSDNSYYENTLNSIRHSEMDIDGQLVIIKKELENTYTERNIFLLNSIYQYLLDVSGKESNDLITGIKEFHGMWEHMLGKVVDNRIDINNRLTAPVYKISDEYILASSRGHKTDIVIKESNTNRFIIIDAKYYKASNTSDAPGLSDIVKQFYYAKALGLVEDDAEDIRSVFIFPGKGGDIESIHMAFKSSKKKYSHDDCLDEQYPPILCLYQDPIELVSYYSHGKKLKKLTQKITDIGINNAPIYS
ncbi:LlaJI family restriction endonuclease [Pectobacterium sp. B2J-2]|uniref:LlaJI family restriction endonuclease n=1 Tax=Pectobacterium sp. B2J-2 TaxID=3385372 RepID=UPI0038FD116B